VKINNFVPWLKQLPPPPSKKLAAEIDPKRSVGKTEGCKTHGRNFSVIAAYSIASSAIEIVSDETSMPMGPWQS
jgi:hypothetical protein